MRDVIKSYKVLADETNLRILNLLFERECCVCEIMQVLEISQSKASRHLSALYDAGFLQLKREGLWALYSIEKNNLSEYKSLLLRTVTISLRDNGTLKQDRELLKGAERVGPSCAAKIRMQKTRAKS